MLKSVFAMQLVYTEFLHRSRKLKLRARLLVGSFQGRPGLRGGLLHHRPLLLRRRPQVEAQGGGRGGHGLHADGPGAEQDRPHERHRRHGVSTSAAVKPRLQSWWVQDVPAWTSCTTYVPPFLSFKV